MSIRDLWASVMLQTCDDIETMDYASLEYSHAAAFFCERGGEWARSRQTIADFMELHAGDLERIGRSLIAARHLRDGGPPVAVRHPRRASLPAAPPPSPVTVVSPLLVVVPGDKASTPRLNRVPRVKRDRTWWIEKFMTKRSA